MTKKEMITQINDHAKSFTGCDGLYGIKGYSHTRLAVMLVAYEVMAGLNEKCNALLAEYGVTQYDTIQFSLMGENAPEWYKEYWQCKMQAIEIWRTHY